MNRTLTKSFQIPAGSMTVFTLTSLLTTIVFYDRVFVPIARKLTRLERGISFLTRMGIGFCISVLATLVARFIERKRKKAAFDNNLIDKPHETIPITAPESMRSTAIGVFWMAIADGNYFSTLMVTMVHKLMCFGWRFHDDYLLKPVNRRNLTTADSSSMKIAIFVLLVLCCISICFSSPVSVSDGVFAAEASIGRNLLQAKKPCPVNFEFMNYTIITSRCKGPRYPANLCCQAFKDFACPYSQDLNDLENECSSTMFSYINLYGGYPPGLFASLCRDDKVGLICPALAPGTGKNGVGADSNNSYSIHSPLLPLVISAVCFILLFRWF
ncbi:hypothetical protein LXL04_037238 [Taraxacum kok-saghyz]